MLPGYNEEEIEQEDPYAASEPSAMPPLMPEQTPMPTMADFSNRDSLINAYKEQADTLDDRYNSSVAKLYEEEQPMSLQQGLGMGISTLLPMIIGGALGGKKGLQMGVGAGITGGSTYTQGLAAEQQRKRKLAELEANSAREDRKIGMASLLGLQKDKVDEESALERLRINEAGADRRAGMQIAAREGPPLPEGTRRVILEKYFTAPDGTVDKEGLENAVANLTTNDQLDDFRGGSQLFGLNYRSNQNLDLQAGKADAKNLATPYGIALRLDRPVDQSLLKDAAKTRAEYDSIKRETLPELRAVFSDPRSTASDREAALARAVIELKTLKNMGASFTSTEESLLGAQLPANLTADPSTWGRAFRGAANQQNPMELINKLEKSLRSSAMETIGSVGSIVGERYSPEEARRFGVKTDKDGFALDTNEEYSKKYSLRKSPAEDKTTAVQGDRNPALSSLSKEELDALIRKKKGL